MSQCPQEQHIGERNGSRTKSWEAPTNTHGAGQRRDQEGLTRRSQNQDRVVSREPERGRSAEAGEKEQSAERRAEKHSRVVGVEAALAYYRRSRA